MEAVIGGVRLVLKEQCGEYVNPDDLAQISVTPVVPSGEVRRSHRWFVSRCFLLVLFTLPTPQKQKRTRACSPSVLSLE